MATRRYGRWVIMLKQETPAYSNTSKEASGHCTIEIRNGKGRMTTFAQGLKYLHKDNVYKVCVVSAQNSSMSHSLGVTCALMPIDQKGKGEMKWEFDPDDVGGSGIAIEKFNVVIIAVKSITSADKELITPLVGYVDERVSWKNNYQAFIKDKAPDKNEAPLEINTSQTEHILKETFSEETEKAIENTSADHTTEQVEIQKKEIYPQSRRPLNESCYLKEDFTFDFVLEIPPKEYSQASQALEPEYKSETAIHSSDAGDAKNEQITDNEPEIGNNHENKAPSAANDFYSMFEDAPPDPHKEFKEKILKHQSKMAELVNYKLYSKEESMNNISIQNMHKSKNYDLEYMFRHNPAMNPFEEQLKDYTWIRIALPDLAALPIDVWKYGNHPFLLSGYRKYNHFILGTYFENPSPKYVLGVPGTYYPYYRLKASRLGFRQFKCCENKVPVESDYGYWLMNIINN